MAEEAGVGVTCMRRHSGARHLIGLLKDLVVELLRSLVGQVHKWWKARSPTLYAAICMALAHPPLYLEDLAVHGLSTAQHDSNFVVSCDVHHMFMLQILDPSLRRHDIHG